MELKIQFKSDSLTAMAEGLNTSMSLIRIYWKKEDQHLNSQPFSTFTQYKGTQYQHQLHKGGGGGEILYAILKQSAVLKQSVAEQLLGGLNGFYC